MKYLAHLLLATATAFTLASCAAPGGGGTAGGETQVGPHGAEKFVLLTHLGRRPLNENDPNYAHTIALVIRVEQKMVGGQQEITASASVHRDGPTGALFGVDGLRAHVTQPVDFGTQPRKTAEAHITNSIPASGGKFKTVTAEATMTSTDYPPSVATVTVPGDQ